MAVWEAALQNPGEDQALSILHAYECKYVYMHHSSQ